jgi:hypothetical protein
MDPITLSLIGSALGQGISALGQRKGLKEQEARYQELGTQGEAQAEKLRKEREGMYGVGPTMRKYMQYAMQDPTADLQRQEAQRQAGTAIGALKAGGARALLGGLGAQQQQAASTMAQIGADEYGRKTGAMARVGQMEERLRQEQRGDIGADLAMARAQARSGMEGAFQAGQQRRQLGYDFAGGLVGTLGQAAGAGLFGGGAGGGAEAFNNLDFGGGLEGLQQLSGTPNQTAELERLQAALRAAGIDAAGGKVKKTPGEFSHRSNPIDVMQDGAKIGELTGGEYVLNPEQAAAIARQSKYAAQLFKKFDKQSR